MLHLADVAAQERDKAIVLAAEIAVVAQIDESEIWQLLQSAEERLERRAVEVAICETEAPAFQSGGFGP